MKSDIRHIALGLLLPALAVLAACTDSNCYDNGSAIPYTVFYTSGTTTERTIGGITIKGIGAPGDTLLADNEIISDIYLPLRASTNETTYSFSWKNVSDSDTVAITDYVTLRYEPVVYFHSAECGAMYNFQLTDIEHTTNGIDSVVAAKPLITNSTDVALRIYFAQEE